MGFLEGRFSDTLPNTPIDQLALMRLHGDLHESTLDAITALYDKCRRADTSSSTATTILRRADAQSPNSASRVASRKSCTLSTGQPCTAIKTLQAKAVEPKDVPQGFEIGSATATR